MKQVSPAPSKSRPAISSYVLCWSALGLAYMLIFVQTNGLSLVGALRAALANILPAFVLTLPVIKFLTPYARAKSRDTALLIHVCGALAFTTVWSLCVLVGLAAARAALGEPFELRAFTPTVAGWQAFQGLMIYTASVAGALAASAAPAQTPGLRRYLIRADDELLPIDVAMIVFIEGADDYSQVQTTTGRHLVRMSIGAFEQRLCPEAFLRVDRSRLINFERLSRAEPAGGGRLTLHMDNGAALLIGRSGAKAIRNRLA